VTVFTLPSNSTLVELGDLRAETGADDLEADLGELRFAATFAEPETVFTLWRRPLREEEITARKRTIVRRENPTRTAADLEKLLEADENVVDVDRDSVGFGGNSKGSSSFGSAKLTWTKGIDGEPHRRMAILFRGSEQEWLYTALLAAQGPSPPGEEGEEGDEELAGVFEAVNRSMALDRGTQVNWYEKQLSFDAPLRFNLFFSIGSSLAFAALMLALGWWRLTRIEF